MLPRRKEPHEFVEIIRPRLLITGFVTTLHHLSGGVWAYLGGVIFDRSGGYEAAFFFSALLALLAVGCALAIQEKHRSTAA